MKIKFWDRAILFLGALFIVCAGGYLVALGIQETWALAPCLVLGIPTVFFGVYLFLFPQKYAVDRGAFVVQHTENGELRIAIKAIESLVKKCIDTHEEIKVVSMKIHNGRDGVTVDLCISLANNISIPLAVASLQKQIKQYLAASSGIELKEVRVSVETTEADIDASPYLVSSDSAAEKQQAPAVPAKVPLHRRIFGRGEEQVTVPEPPKAEEEAPAEETPAAETAPAEAPAPEDLPPEPVTEETAAPSEEMEDADAEEEETIHE